MSPQIEPLSPIKPEPDFVVERKKLNDRKRKLFAKKNRDIPTPLKSYMDSISQKIELYNHLMNDLRDLKLSGASKIRLMIDFLTQVNKILLRQDAYSNSIDNLNDEFVSPALATSKLNLMDAITTATARTKSSLAQNIPIRSSELHVLNLASFNVKLPAPNQVSSSQLLGYSAFLVRQIRNNYSTIIRNRYFQAMQISISSQRASVTTLMQVWVARQNQIGKRYGKSVPDSVYQTMIIVSIQELQRQDFPTKFSSEETSLRRIMDVLWTRDMMYRKSRLSLNILNRFHLIFPPYVPRLNIL